MQTETNENCPLHGSKAKEETKTLIKKFVDEQVTAVKQAYENKLAQLDELNNSLRADILYLQNLQRNASEALTTGRGSTGSTRLTKQDYVEVIEDRLAEASLGEIVEAVYEEKGIDIHNDAQWQALLDPENYGPNLTQMAKRLTK